MKINIITIGRFSDNEHKAIFLKYQKRLTNINLKELSSKHSAKTSIELIKRQEAQIITKSIDSNNFLICLDEKGQEFNSQQFSILIDKVKISYNKDIDFVIGGAYGLDKSLIKLSDLTLSLGKMTLPHILVRIVLIEQIYRAKTISDGHPYHKQ